MIKTIAKFYRSKKSGDIMTRINGRVSFVARGSDNRPKEGESWLVEVVGKNPKGSVTFLNPIRKVITKDFFVLPLEEVAYQAGQSRPPDAVLSNTWRYNRSKWGSTAVWGVSPGELDDVEALERAEEQADFKAKCQAGSDLDRWVRETYGTIPFSLHLPAVLHPSKLEEEKQKAAKWFARYRPELKGKNKNEEIS